jgi:predicted negative regulator of RcsB-dependent stress response
MAAYDPQELEQLEDLKAWWTRHGNKIASVIIVFAVAYLGYQGWRWYSTGHVEAASTLYAAVSEGARTNNPAKAKEAMAQLTDRYAGTPYAPRAALLYAKTLWDSGDKAGARAQLQWVLDHSTDNELLQVTRYRLAETWLDEGKSDEALKLLDAKTDDAFTGIYADLRGDALTVAGRKDDARKAYEIALAKIDPRSPYRNYIEVKFESLGGIRAPAPAVPGATGASTASAKADAAKTDAAKPAAPAKGDAAPAAPAKDAAKP